MSTPNERIIPGQVDCDLYNEHISRYLFAKQFIESKNVLDLAKQFMKSKRVLDLGCGTGYGSKVMADVACKVVGVDISREAITYAKEHFSTKNVSFHIEDCLRLGLADKSFDIVVSFEVIEHIKDYTGLIREVKRVLIDDGIFILSTPNKRYAEEKGEINPCHIHEFYYDELDHLLKEFFGHVQILAENHCPGVSISSPQCKQGNIHFSGGNVSAIDNFFETPSYFIAVCYQYPKSVPAIKRLFYVPLEANILREKERHIKALQEQLKEFDKRSEWAIRLDAELKEKTKWAHELDVELQEKDKYLTQLQREFDERTKHVEKLSKELEEKNQALLQLQREFDERSKWALKLDEELKEKDKYLGKLQHEFDEKAAWAFQLDSKLKERDEYIQCLEHKLEERTTWALQLDAELKKTNQVLANLQQDLAERTKWALKLDAELREKDKYLSKLQHEFDKNASWASQLDLKLKESNQALSKLREEYDERTIWALKLDTDLKDKIALLHTLNQLLQEKDQTIIQLQEDIKKKSNLLAELQMELQSLKNIRLYKLGKKIGLIKS